jgi:mRNA interferase MazF
MGSDCRGQVWLVDLGYVAKTRPAVVMSIEPLDNERALVTLVPHTTSPRATRFEVASGARFLKLGVFDAQNLVTVSNAKLVKKLGELSPNDFAEVTRAVQTWLGLSS